MTNRREDGQRQDHIQPARSVAYEVISAVRDSDAYANILLPIRIRRAGLSRSDAALATELTYGTLRMRGYYDRVISDTSGRSIDEIDPAILDVLRLGVHQLLSMRVASHAAVNESVALARKVGSRSAVGFTNGVLRGVTRATPAEWREHIIEDSHDEDTRMSVLYSHPVWIVRALRQSLAVEGRAEELEALLAADNVAPTVNLVALPQVAVVPADAERNQFSPVGFVFGGGDPYDIVHQNNGAFRVQDEGSQLAALALVKAASIQAGERWLDLCAGPGGKAALLGAYAVEGGATLVANELQPARAGLVRDAVVPVASAVEVRIGDGVALGTEESDSYDRILVDAPCTGLGALRRRPEARWRKDVRDVQELSALQSALLGSAVGALKPGGILAYVTCSPHIAETRLAISSALTRHDGILDVLPTQQIVQNASRHPLDLSGDVTQVQLWPHRHGTDAMFIALMRKKGAQAL